MRLPVSVRLAAILVFLTITYDVTKAQDTSKALDLIKKALEAAAANSNGTFETTTRDPRLTGDPRIDYKLDPNLPRELGNYDLSYYPFYVSVPTDITFKCDGRLDGYYASVPHFCQLFHLCVHGHRHDFLCANYTVFDQSQFICHFANSVNCSNSEHYYERNNELYVTTTTTREPPPAEYDDYDAEAPRPARRRTKRPNRKGGRRRRPRTTTTPSPDYYYDDYEEEAGATGAAVDTEPEAPPAPTQKPSYRKWSAGRSTTPDPEITERPVKRVQIRPPRPVTKAPHKPDPVVEENLDYAPEELPIDPSIDVASLPTEKNMQPVEEETAAAAPSHVQEAPRRRAGEPAQRQRPQSGASTGEEEVAATTFQSAARRRPPGAIDPHDEAAPAEEHQQPPARRHPADRRPTQGPPVEENPGEEHLMEQHQIEAQPHSEETTRHRIGGNRVQRQRATPPTDTHVDEATPETHDTAPRRRPATNPRTAPAQVIRRPTESADQIDVAPVASRRPSGRAEHVEVAPAAARRPTVHSEQNEAVTVRGRRPAVHRETTAAHVDDLPVEGLVGDEVAEPARRRAAPRRSQQPTTLRELRRPVRAPPALPPPEEEEPTNETIWTKLPPPAVPVDTQGVINGILSGLGAVQAAAARTYRPPTINVTTTPGPLDPSNVVNSILAGAAAPTAQRVSPSARISTTAASVEKVAPPTPKATNAAAAIRRGQSKHVPGAGDVEDVAQREEEQLAAQEKREKETGTTVASADGVPGALRRKIVQRRRKVTTTTTEATTPLHADVEYEYVE